MRKPTAQPIRLSRIKNSTPKNRFKSSFHISRIGAIKSFMHSNAITAAVTRIKAIAFTSTQIMQEFPV